MKSAVFQRYILKIHSSRLRRAKWSLTLPLREARKNDEVIAVTDSQMMRFIDGLNHAEDGEEAAAQIRRRIAQIKREPSSLGNRKEIRALYEQLDELQYRPDYLFLVMDSVGDYRRSVKGFKINGIRYARLVGTNGGVKNSTIVFVSERLAPELRRLIDNDRNPGDAFVPAKLEAYRALVCSGSTPVSYPKGVLIVDDCVTKFREDVITLSDAEPGEPKMGIEKDFEIELDESDGYGLMLPSLAERWSQELGLSYTAGGFNTRLSFEKGMVFCFDFLDFAEKEAHGFLIKDAWGDERDIRDVELILTTSMVKLWKSYESGNAYMESCVRNGYMFGLTKVAPETLETVRSLNYQFIQSYDLTDRQIRELIEPSVREVKDVLRGDWRSAVLFQKGAVSKQATESADRLEGDAFTAMMIEPKLFDDPFVKESLYSMIRKRIDDMKIGVIGVHGNYSIVGGDPFALCQHIFGLPVTGLLASGEVFNGWWASTGAERLACFRAPMSCHSNIRKVSVRNDERTSYWYRYIPCCTLFNAWDSAAAALNGMDKDGDLVFLTDNKVLVDNIRQGMTIMCAQKTAAKIVPTESDLIEANINSFGDDIGSTTNKITSMYEVQSHFDKDSEEYRILDYRIKSGQLLQQNCIDKAKGIISKPMPKEWYNYGSTKVTDGMTEGEAAVAMRNRRIVAEKKPYFMRYIYPTLAKQYNDYIKNTAKKCIREFRKPINSLLAAGEGALTPEEATFVSYYYQRMPVGTGDCVMNRLCRMVEGEFSDIGKVSPDLRFDTSFITNGTSYTVYQKRQIEAVYEDYVKMIRCAAIQFRYEKADKEERSGFYDGIRDDALKRCYAVCSDERQLLDVVIDTCYKSVSRRRFVWRLFPNEIIRSLLAKKDCRIQCPVEDPEGDISYGGRTFRFEERSLSLEIEISEEEAQSACEEDSSADER